MKYFSMFTGIGGFEIGIHNAYRSTFGREQADSQRDKGQRFFTKEGQDFSTSERLPSERSTNFSDERPLCVGYSEIDKYAIETYENRFGKEVKNYGDATTINTAELPDFDLLVGGFPCQAFSVAGKRAGFNDTRGTLIFDVVRILRDKRPRHFVLENVKGLLSHESGKTFSHILEILTDSGYDVSWSVHNSKNYGVPQNRERVYIVGHLRGTPRPEVFPISGTDQEDTRIVGQDVAYTIDANYSKGTNTLAKGRRSVVAIPEATKKGYAEAKPGDAINLTAINSKTRRGRVSDVAPTLDTGMQLHTLTEDVQIRRLTPTECERLQGFPDGWTIGSDTQRYKQCGNAVTVNVVNHVISEMMECF